MPPRQGPKLCSASGVRTDTAHVRRHFWGIVLPGTMVASINLWDPVTHNMKACEWAHENMLDTTAIMEIHLKLQSHFTSTGMATVNKTPNSMRRPGRGDTGALPRCWWERNMVHTLWRTVWTQTRRIYLSHRIVRSEWVSCMVGELSLNEASKGATACELFGTWLVFDPHVSRNWNGH